MKFDTPMQNTSQKLCLFVAPCCVATTVGRPGVHDQQRVLVYWSVSQYPWTVKIATNL